MPDKTKKKTLSIRVKELETRLQEVELLHSGLQSALERYSSGTEHVMQRIQHEASEDREFIAHEFMVFKRHITSRRGLFNRVKGLFRRTRPNEVVEHDDSSNKTEQESSRDDWGMGQGSPVEGEQW